MNINFREIDKTNYNTCCRLAVGEHQKDYVASNAFSLVQSAYEEGLYPLGIYDGDEMVGFLLYDYDEELEGWSFSRFMIDINHQNKGYGTIALRKFLEFFHNKFPNEKIYTSVETDNEIAIKLYEGFGFVKVNSFEYKIEEKVYREFRMIKEKW
ncbi:GNAT family N-acetyltransferase [Clostridium sp. D53t1_180928_C8]|uniref:GNAT family N-acetyltransferase n=1 Tax=Clostridium sp. D53t1_180928_C8 TaxID=2787101 RepID=UPI0018A8DCB7|nr:GNAT family N-acetyltransferase [Clostridium sp. D53t1_180928_C8]